MPDDFEQHVADYCRRHDLFPDTDGSLVLVAVSGGGDSVALLTVLSAIGKVQGFRVEAAHLNHSLRGDESDEDERFVRNLCGRMSIFLTVEKLPEGYLHASDASVETAARDARMAFLVRTSIERKAARIATGHTLDDQAETLMQRIIRGTGPAGLAGIRPLRDNLWIRPLLDESRADIRRYLDEKHIGYRNDSSNDDTGYFRNRIRHELIPLIQNRFSPGFTQAMARLAELADVQEEYFERVTASAFDDVCLLANRYKILLDKSKLVAYHNVVKQRLIRRCLAHLEGEGRTTDMDEIGRVLGLLDCERDEIDITSAVRCGTGGGVLAFELISDVCESISLAIPGDTVIPCGGGRITAEMTGSVYDVDGVSSVLIGGHVGALSVGPLKSGERMVPFGMKKPVKIADILAGSALPKLLRRTVPVVRADGVPVWIPGLKSAEELRMNRGAHAGCDVIRLAYHDGIRWV